MGDDERTITPYRDSDEHRKFLKGHYWRLRKKEYFSRNPRKCVCCKSKKVHLHHRTYATIGEEPDSDLIPLCGFHHQDLHKYGIMFELSVEDATTLYLAVRLFENYQEVLLSPLGPYVFKIRELEEEAERDADYAYTEYGEEF